MKKFIHALIIDDSRLAREGLSSLLTTAGLKTTLAQTAKAGLSEIQKERPDLIFIDSRMPDCNVYEVVRSLVLSEEAGSIPIVICASKDTPDERKRAQQSGARGFLVKPITARMVERTLNLLQSSESEGSAAISERTESIMPELDQLPELKRMVDSDDIPILDLPVLESTAPISTPSPIVATQNDAQNNAQGGAEESAHVSASHSSSDPSADSSRVALDARTLDEIMEKLQGAVQELAQETAQKIARQIALETSQQTAAKVGGEAGAQAGGQAGLEAGAKAGESRGAQAGDAAGRLAGQQAGEIAGEKSGAQAAQRLVERVVKSDLTQWKSLAKSDVYEQVHNQSLPVVRALTKEMSEQIAREVAAEVADQTAKEQAKKIGRSVASEVSQVTARKVASQTAQTTAQEAMDQFTADWRRKLRRYTLLVSLLGVVLAGGVTLLLQKYPLFF